MLAYMTKFEKILKILKITIRVGTELKKKYVSNNILQMKVNIKLFRNKLGNKTYFFFNSNYFFLMSSRKY